VWERAVKQAGFVTSSTSDSVVWSMPGCALENVLGVYL
jgi:hypothetical protein